MNAAAPFDAEKFKAATREIWNQHARGWNDKSALIRNWLHEPTAAMIEMADIRPGMRVLDIAAGAGDQTLDLAKRVGPEGHVLATDLSPVILEFAKSRAQSAGYNYVETQVADGESLGGVDASFDAVVCRLGLMFYPNPGKGTREMFRVLKPGGSACTMVFSSPDQNPCIAILVSTALKHAGLPPPDPYQPGGLLSLGKPGLIDALFRNAGFSHVATTRIAAPFRLPSVKDYLDFIRTSASPIVALLSRLDDGARAAAWAEIEDKLTVFNTAGGWEGPNELLLTAGNH